MSKVVFVGNVPYHIAEEQLIDVFKSVGHVAGLRLVFDRDTGKAKGYGFCEFADHETAASAVRNLNGVEVGGRNLRIDLADPDPQLEGKTTVRGEILDDDGRRHDYDRDRDRRDRDRFRDRDNRERESDRNKNSKAQATANFLASIPTGKPVPPGVDPLDMITKVITDMSAPQVMEVLAQMKAFVIKHREEARALLVAHPQFAYALFQALLTYQIVDPILLEKMRDAVRGPPTAPQAHNQRAPPGYPPQAPSHHGYPHHMSQNMPPPSNYPPMTSGSMMPPPHPPNAAQHQQPGMYGMQQNGQMYPPAYPASQQPGRAMPPPQSSTPPVAPPAVASEEQKALIAQVMAMTPEQISLIPDPDSRAMLEKLRAQFSGVAPA